MRSQDFLDRHLAASRREFALAGTPLAYLPRPSDLYVSVPKRLIAADAPGCVDHHRRGSDLRRRDREVTAPPLHERWRLEA